MVIYAKELDSTYICTGKRGREDQKEVCPPLMTMIVHKRQGNLEQNRPNMYRQTDMRTEMEVH